MVRNLLIILVMALVVMAVYPESVAAFQVSTEVESGPVEQVNGGWTFSRFWRGFGRFHPLVVHFPIAFLLGAFLLELWALARRRESSGSAARAMVLLGATSAVVAAFMGWELAEGTSSPADLEAIDRHRWSGVVTAVLATVLAVAAFKAQGNRGWIRNFYRVTLLVTAIVVGFAGHEGGKLVYGESYFSRALGDMLGRTATRPAIPDGESSVGVFGLEKIRPIFADNCFRCHGPKKQKHDLRLDTREFIMKGGEDGPVVVPSDSAASSLYKCLITEDEDERMPYDEDPLHPDQIAAIRKWIDEGAR